MLKKYILFGSAVLFIGLSIIISGYFIGTAIKSTQEVNKSTASTETKVMSLTQAAEYLSMTEKEVSQIIQLEKNQLEKTGSFYGKRFPYFKIDDKIYFYKDEIDEWLKEASSSHREYNSVKGWVLN